jgi:hypothetical protein
LPLSGGEGSSHLNYFLKLLPSPLEKGWDEVPYSYRNDSTGLTRAALIV